MGNYTYSIVTQALVKKYRSINVLLTSACFGNSTDLSQKILKQYKSYGIAYFRPFLNKTCSQIALFNYKNPIIKKSLWEAKFTYKQRYVHLYASLIAELLIEQLSELSLTHNFTRPVICIVPSHKKRIRKRHGYYSNKILAESIHKQLNDHEIKIDIGLIQKVRETTQQSRTKNRSERITNPQGAFACNQHKSISKNIILLDDVYTTGATMGECTQVLIKSGAKRILQITIAK